MFVYYVNVPLNNKGIEEFENYDAKMSNVQTFELTQEEYYVLRVGEKSLFSILEKRIGIIIDQGEEERIDFENLAEAYNIVKKRKARSDTEKLALGKIKESLEMALKSKTFWEIDIFLE